MGLTLSAVKSEKVQLGREAELFTLKVQKQGLISRISYFLALFIWNFGIWK